MPVFDPQWRLIDLRPSSEPADQAAVRRRLEAVWDHLERFLRAKPGAPGADRLDVAEAVDALPLLDGTLTDAIDRMPWHHRSHRGNFLHNAMHAAGLAH